MAKNKGVGGHGGGETTQSVMCLHQKHAEMLKRPDVASTSITPELGLQRHESPELLGQQGYSTSFRFNQRKYLKIKVDRAV